MLDCSDKNHQYHYKKTVCGLVGPKIICSAETKPLRNPYEPIFSIDTHKFWTKIVVNVPYGWVSV